MALVSPGIQVTVTDEAQYLPTAIGSVPFVVIATAQNKTINGVTAPGTTKERANTIYGITSQRELTTIFGAPIFRRSSADTPLHGDELNEYGLMAAYSALGIGNRVWVVRADINLNDLVGTSIRPRGYVANKTNWLNISSTDWGIYEFNDSITSGDTPFTKKLPIIINSLEYTSSVYPFDPLPNVGDKGDYAIVTLPNMLDGTSKNSVYYKNYNNEWVVVGSSSWVYSIPQAVSTRTTLSALMATTGNVFTGQSFTINGNVFTNAGSAITNITDLNTFINTQINTLGVPGVSTRVSNTDRLEFYANAIAASTGQVGTPDGKIRLVDGVGSPLERLGLLGLPPSLPANVSHAHVGNVSTTGVAWNWSVTNQKWHQGNILLNSATVVHSPYTAAPSWRREQYAASTPRPNGSVWIKTSSEGDGFDLVYSRYNGVSNTWMSLAGKVYADAYAANYNLDRTGGGLNIAQGSIFVMRTPLNNGEVGFKIYTQSKTGQTKVTGVSSTWTSLAAGQSFVLKASQLDGTISTNTCTIGTIGGSSGDQAKAFVKSIQDQNIPNVSAVVETSGEVSIIHRSGGIISLQNTSGIPLTFAGFTTTTPGVLQYVGGANGSVHLTNWAVELYEISSTTPAANPVDGTLWYYSDPATIDIMVNDDSGWKGYRNVSADVRGYNLSLTDPLGVIVSGSEPVVQQGGGALESGDLWLDSSDLENYPKIYRYDKLTRKWNLINNADRLTQNGIVFADTRWDTTGTTDPITGSLPTIASLLTSNYIDQDAPDYRLFPRGTLLFNTRRSGYTVKRFVGNYFNATNFPDVPTVPGASSVLPTSKSTWKSDISYKSNGHPAMGHYAQRNEVAAAMKAAIDSNTALREESYNFNLLAAPGYPELIPNLVALNRDRGETGFIIGDSSMVLPNLTTSIINYESNEIVTGTPYLAVYYPSAITNDLSGNDIAVPASHMMLRTFLYNDQVSYPWFAPAGTRRGLIDNVLGIGYVDSNTGTFVRTGINNALRDTLYERRINPITLLNQVGIVAYGQKTRNSAISGAGSSLDRINVARLVNYIRTILSGVANQFIFEPNDKITRDQIKTAIESLLNDLVAKRGVYDYLVVCDDTNNTGDRIARNELYVDIAIEPMKAVEFIYIPIRLKNPGTIGGSSVTV